MLRFFDFIELANASVAGVWVIMAIQRLPTRGKQFIVFRLLLARPLPQILLVLEEDTTPACEGFSRPPELRAAARGAGRPRRREGVKREESSYSAGAGHWTDIWRCRTPNPIKPKSHSRARVRKCDY